MTMETAEQEYPIVSNDPAKQAQYVTMRKAGQAHGMAAILATRRAPGAKTNRELFRGIRPLGDQFNGEENMLRRLQANAEREGVSVGYNSLYVPGLAKYPMDPLACVPSSEGAGYVKKLCEARGLDCEGLVTVKTGTRDPAERKQAKRKPDARVEAVKRKRVAARAEEFRPTH